MTAPAPVPGYRFGLSCPVCGYQLVHHSDETTTQTLRRTFTYCETCGEFYAVTVTLRRLPAQRRPDYAGPRYQPRVA